MSRYRKTIAAALGAAGIALVAALTDGTVSPAETAGIAVAVLTALGVYVAPNTPPAPKPGEPLPPGQRWTI